MNIGVHLHLYYLDQWEFFKEQLKYLEDCETKIIITTSETKLKEAKKIVDNFKCDIYGLENRGYDVAPFIFALNQMKSFKPDIVLKLHTKGHNKSKKYLWINGLYYRNALEWRSRQVRGLLGSKENIKEIVKKFFDKKIGIAGGREFLHPCKMKKTYAKKLKKIFDIKEENIKPFFAGTMFWIRWNICEIIMNKLKFQDFDFVNTKTDNFDTLAHCFEDYINSIVDRTSLKTVFLDINLNTILFMFWRSYNPLCLSVKLLKKGKKFIFNKKITKSNRMIIKVCKIPIYSKLLIKQKMI